MSGCFAKVADQKQLWLLWCDPGDFSAVQIVEAEVVMTFPLPGDLSSSYRGEKVN